MTRLSAEGDWFSLSSSQNPLRAETEKHSINFKTNPWGEIGHWPPFVRAAAGENPSKKRLLNYFTACSPLRSIGNTRDDSPPGLNVSVLSFKRSCRSSIICSRGVSTLLFTKLRHLEQHKSHTLVLSRIIVTLWIIDTSTFVQKTLLWISKRIRMRIVIVTIIRTCLTIYLENVNVQRYTDYKTQECGKYLNLALFAVVSK